MMVIGWDGMGREGYDDRMGMDSLEDGKYELMGVFSSG
jgi:hypothetical protein